MPRVTPRYRWVLLLDVSAIIVFIILGIFAPLQLVWFVFAALWAAVAVRRAILEVRRKRLDR
ncbi:hypothetical protein [Microbacterium sp. 13-71-7]|uniref:hypothetical protein n=1 Tax=Microbacterium sp. 13-71-7 TaxID=1970399 RepID=UPI000BCF0F3A|nr:hypothetical protein [Microbacterium sp. 13-71-7]OZB82570.1 MAG: hypothetical protein B7X32_13175 [Microbacterium sp. 13-71-7]